MFNADHNDHDEFSANVPPLLWQFYQECQQQGFSTSQAYNFTMAYFVVTLRAAVGNGSTPSAQQPTATDYGPGYSTCDNDVVFIDDDECDVCGRRTDEIEDDDDDEEDE